MKIKLNANSHFGAQLRLTREQKDISQVKYAKALGAKSVIFEL